MKEYTILELLQFLPDEYRNEAIEKYNHPDNEDIRNKYLDKKFNRISDALSNAFSWFKTKWNTIYWQYANNKFLDIPQFDKKEYFIKMIEEL